MVDLTMNHNTAVAAIIPDVFVKLRSYQDSNRFRDLSKHAFTIDEKNWLLRIGFNATDSSEEQRKAQKRLRVDYKLPKNFFASNKDSYITFGVFIRGSFIGNNFVIIALTVDDGAIAACNEEDANQVITKLESTYKITKQEVLTSYAGFNIQKTSTGYY